MNGQGIELGNPGSVEDGNAMNRFWCAERWGNEITTIWDTGERFMMGSSG